MDCRGKFPRTQWCRRVKVELGFTTVDDEEDDDDDATGGGDVGDELEEDEEDGDASWSLRIVTLDLVPLATEGSGTIEMDLHGNL